MQFGSTINGLCLSDEEQEQEHLPYETESKDGYEEIEQVLAAPETDPDNDLN